MELSVCERLDEMSSPLHDKDDALNTLNRTVMLFYKNSFCEDIWAYA